MCLNLRNGLAENANLWQKGENAWLFQSPKNIFFALDKYDNLLKAYCVCGLQLVRPEKLKLRESMFNFDPAFVVKNYIRGQLLR